MKKISLIFIGILLFTACKKEAKEIQVVNENSSSETINEAPSVTKTGERQLKGEFIYLGDAAVLQTPSEVYGVVIDSMMHVLNDQVKKYKKTDTDMVPVAIKGNVVAKPENEEGWPYKIEVLEVLKVYQPKADSNNVIKLEKQTK